MSANVNVSDRINILLVDDQPAKLLSYEAILGEMDVGLLKASSARQALEHLLKTDVAVVLMDVCMPETDGFELAAMIREHPRFQKTAIIFVSAINVTDLDRLRGYEAGAVDYVPVPVVPEVLRAKVRVFVELYRKTRELEFLNHELESRVLERTAALEASRTDLSRLNEDLERRIEERTGEREHALAQLFEAQKLDTIGHLTGGVAHDFNNLLMAVLGSLELLRKHLPDDPRVLRLLDNAVQGAQRGAALTQRLLAFARRQELKPEIVGIGDLVSGIEALLERAVGAGVRLETNIAADLPPVLVDANQLELALLNLAVNARDAMPLGGSLVISASVEVFEKTGVLGLSPGSYLRVSVVDTGFGMDAATLAKASEPFFTTKGPGKGTGLGLSMVHGLAAQSGGRLRLSSRAGHGTTVDLWLPQAKTGHVPMPATAASHQHSNCRSAPCTILVVDDDALVSVGTAAMLDDLGHKVLEANSGAQALEILRNNDDIEVIVTDHAMPGMTGTELAARIAKEFPELKVLLATGYAELGEREGRGLSRLAKPYSQEELASAIARLRAIGASASEGDGRPLSGGESISREQSWELAPHAALEAD